MNKYLKNCLVIYSALALMLMGMAGAAYAITATDADQYVTRSQYAVDMAHLQNKLDEAEAGLMGNINRYRSTNVKFVTYDTPTKQHLDGTAFAGYYNGGNFFPRRPQVGGAVYMYSPRTNDNTAMRNGYNTLYYLWRFYNGNYILNKALYHYSEGSNPTTVTPLVSYAIPVENFPGWYLINRIVYGYTDGWRTYTSLVKLDPNTSVTAADIAGKTIQVRYKKDFFIPGTRNQTLPTVSTTTVGCNYWQGVSYAAPVQHYCQPTVSATGTYNVTITNSLDSETGDYITNYTGLAPWYSGYVQREYYVNTDNNPTRLLIPKDNVEYVLGGTSGAFGELSGPPMAYIGLGTNDDQFWRYEFVDCENGIKYWHAWRSPDHDPSNTVSQVIHYCFPILY